MMRFWRVLTVVALALSVAPFAAATAAERDDGVVKRLGVIETRADRLELAASFTSGRTILSAGGAPAVQLMEQPAAPLMGWLAPVAMESPDRRLIVYNAAGRLREIDPYKSFSDQGINRDDVLEIPTLRVHDVRSGADRIFEEGAYSVAMSSDGEIAYVRGLTRELRAGERYLGHVFVRGSLDDFPVQWTTEPDRYVVAGWAGDHLIVYTIGVGEALNLYVLDGPGSIRLLASDGSLVAISPDGTQAFVEHSTKSPLVHILNVADGSEVARYNLRQVAAAVGEPRVSLSYAGSWEGDRVVARASMGLVIFNVGGGSIQLEKIYEVDPASFPMGIAEPRLVANGDRIIARGVVPLGGPETGPFVTMLLDCDAAGGMCTAAEVPGALVQAAYNPSRPLRLTGREPRERAIR